MVRNIPSRQLSHKDALGLQRVKQGLQIDLWTCVSTACMESGSTYIV